MFNHVAGHGAFRFKPADRDKLSLLKARLGPISGHRVLEPGCGSGPLTEWLARWVAPGGVVEAFDPSAGMLENAARNLRGLHGVILTEGRCEQLEWPEKSFDLVLCFRVLPHFDDVDAVLRRFARWLVPGGRLLIVHWEGRAALNALHAHHGPVEEDVFPQRSYLEPTLQRRGFAIRGWIENDEEIFIEAELGSTPATGSA
jgi:demethylmenaquinone methyltransferase/2-methoxy-6-polyprenyl-1,4-benzoquinol methylase